MRRRVLVVQPSFQPPGGGNGVAAWVLQALQDHHDVGTLSWKPLDVEEINRFYGTSVRRPHQSYGVSALVHLIDAFPTSIALLKHALLVRVLKNVGHDWDVLISVNNEVDFGRPGIQYVHYPAYLRPRPLAYIRWYHGPPFVHDVYWALADALGGISVERAARNRTLVNSDWTGGVYQRQHGQPTTTVYPPVTVDFADVPWEERVDGFLCIGRIAPEKELDRVIDIVAGVRRHRPHMTLRLVGTFGTDAYSRRIRARCATLPWITLDENVSRQALIALIPTYRYGIHGMLEEHFGMAPAEMVCAGCIVFVHGAGGQVEVVCREPRLTYSTVENAVDSILHVVTHPDEQAALRDRLAGQKQAFSIERFMADMRDVVASFEA